MAPVVDFEPRISGVEKQKGLPGPHVAVVLLT